MVNFTNLVFFIDNYYYHYYCFVILKLQLSVLLFFSFFFLASVQWTLSKKEKIKQIVTNSTALNLTS